MQHGPTLFSYPAFVTGFALSATLIVAIGAQNAFVLRQGLERRHVAAIVLFCAAADLSLICLGVGGLSRVLGAAPMLTRVLTAGGLVFLTCYGVRALRRALHPSGLEGAAAAASTLRASLAQAAAFTFLNPHVYLDTVVLMGAIGARQPPGARPWFVAGAAVASGTWFSLLGFGARIARPLFARPRAWQVLDAIIGVSMLAIAADLLRRSLG